MSFTSGELRDFVDAVRGSETSTECVVTGTVARVDPDGTAWVQIGQNAEPTPCARNMACHAGDEVTVRIADHKATVTGNASAPATDDHAANVAHGVASVAQETATVAQDTAEVAQNTAIQAKKVASNAATKADVAEIAAQEAARVASAVNQHFWDDERGAHVTEEKKDDYLVEPSGFQNLMTSLGNIFTKAVNGIERILRSDTASGVVIYDGECAPDAADLADHVVAAFTADGAQIGKSGGVHIAQHFNEMTMSDGNGTEFFGVRDLRNADGLYLWTDKFTVNPRGTENEYPLTFAPLPMEGGGYAIQVYHGTTLTYGTDYTLDIVSEAGEDFATLRTTNFYSSGTITVQLITNNRRCQNISLGGGAVGAMAAAFGTNNTEATGFGSNAMGASARASGLSAHAEGGERQASIPSDETTSIASGDFSHAEGVSWATGKAAHSEGYATRAQSLYSHTEGEGTVAPEHRHARKAVHVEGRWNELDVNGEYAHIIGDGTSNTNRSNLHTVSGSGVAWYKNHGNVICSDGTNIKCGGETLGTADNLAYVSSGELFRVQNCISPSHSIPANWGELYTYNVPSISGYKAIGVVGFQNTAGGNVACVSAFVNITAQTISTYNRNLTNAAFNLNDHVRVLYIRDGFTV